MFPDFQPFAKIARLMRPIVVTEKVDGTNAQILITPDAVLAGSRNRWLTVDADNFGFAKWVASHAEELRTGLGEGQHFGEWYGQGIQRGYGLTEKRFALFNSKRWAVPPPPCGVVPVLYSGPMDLAAIGECIERLRVGGSVISPGFAKPEGVVIFHSQCQTMFKVTLEKDEERKGEQGQ